MNSPHAEALVIRRERPLELVIVDESTPILIRRLETRHHVGVRTWREGRRHQGCEWAPVRRRPAICRGRAIVGLPRRRPAVGIAGARRAMVKTRHLR